MEAVFGWLGQIFQAILSLFPRRVIVHKGQKMLKYKCFGSVVEKKHGLRWYFPFLTSVEVIPIARQAINDLLPIKFMTDKNVPCSADASCVFIVTDASQFCTENFDTANMIGEAVSASLCSVLMDRKLEDLKDLDRLNDEITDVVNADCEGFGIELEYVRINNLTTIIPLAQIQS